VNQTVCPMCDFPGAEERTYSETVVHEGRKIEVKGVRHYVCPKCDSEFMDDQQSRQNLVLAQSALGETPRYVLPNQIKQWREQIGLTQREAAMLFGGGINAFSKYENGTIVQTDAMDNLLWITMRYPGLICDLATRHHMTLPEKILNTCGGVLQFSNHWASTDSLPLTVAGLTAKSLSDWFVAPGSIVPSLTLSVTVTSANDQQFALAA
jgi:HTH-type transcriptional regulator / antitoxin MqsA